MFKQNTNKLIIVFLFGLFIFHQACLCSADEFNLQLTQGQNFISLPLNLTDPFIQQALYSIDGKYTNIWLYDNADPENLWKHYHPDYMGFSDLLNINLGLGYWLEALQDTTLTVSGSAHNTSFILSLKAGWNVIGWPYLENQSVQSILYSLTFGADYSRLCRFNPQTKSFEEQFDSFEPGRAYYIYTLRDCTVTILPLPQISITHPAADSLFNTPAIIVSGTVSYAGITVEVNDVPATVNNTNFSANIALTEGQNTVTAEATNQAGNTASDSITVTLDSTPPAIPALNSVTSPTNQNTQTLSGTKEANSSIWINGVEKIAFNGATSWSINVALSEGGNTFNITAKDEALNESQAAVASILLDTSAPSTPLVTDDGAVTASATQLHASWSCEDLESGIVEYQYAIGTASGGRDILDWTSCSSQTEINSTGLSLIQGETYFISVKAKNAAGSWSEAGSSDGITLNQNIPVILSIQPSDGTYGYAEDSINFSVEAEDQDGDSLLYQFSINGQVVQPWGASNVFDWDSAQSDTGIHTIKVEANDNNGGIVSQEIELCLFRRPPGPPL